MTTESQDLDHLTRLDAAMRSPDLMQWLFSISMTQQRKLKLMAAEKMAAGDEARLLAFLKTDVYFHRGLAATIRVIQESKAGAV